MQCLISPNLFPWRNKLIYILDGLMVSTFTAHFHFWVNYSFKSLNSCVITGQFSQWPHNGTMKKNKRCSSESLGKPPLIWHTPLRANTHMETDGAASPLSDLLCSREILRKINDLVWAGTLVIQIHMRSFFVISPPSILLMSLWSSCLQSY